MTRTIALLACAPDGSLAAVRTADGRIWLLSSQRQREIQEFDIDVAIAQGDLERVDLTLPSWKEVDEELNLRAQRWLDKYPPRGVGEYDVETIEEIVDDCDREPGDYRKLALALLRDAPAAKDARVHGRLLDLLGGDRGTATGRRLSARSIAQVRANERLAA